MEWGSQASLQNLPRVGTLGKDLDNYLGILKLHNSFQFSSNRIDRKKLTHVRTVLVRSWLNTTLKQSDCYSISSGILFHNLSYANADKNWGQHLHQIVICVGANFLRRNSGRQHGRRARFVHAQMVPSKSFFLLERVFRSASEAILLTRPPLWHDDERRPITPFNLGIYPDHDLGSHVYVVQGRPSSLSNFTCQG